MNAGGQTLNDRILAARHSIAGQGLAKAVCKATTEELSGPKRKHLDYLLRCTEEPNVSIPTLANLLIERTQNQSWVVVFKALVTIHHLMCYGNERFTQYFASSNSNFQLSGFLDKTGAQARLCMFLSNWLILDPFLRASVRKAYLQERDRGGGTVQGYDMSPFVRRYAKYMSSKSVSYRTVAFDFCKVKRGKDGGTLRQMNTEKLLKTLPVLQEQVDALLEFEATTQDLNNGVINSAFMLLFRDLIRLFACYNDGIINMLEKYFDMNKKQARDALDIYKKFLIRMDRVADFLKVAENVGIDKGDIPDLAKAPSSLLEALEAHLASLEGRKPGSLVTTPTGAARVNISSAVNVLSSTSNSFGTAAYNSAQIDEKIQRQLLAEEEMAMAKYKEQKKATNPFFGGESAGDAAAGATGDAPNILDLFGVGSAAAAAAPVQPQVATSSSSSAGKVSDDLLQLSGNPFASLMAGAAPSQPQQPQPTAAFGSPFGGFSDYNAAPNANGNLFGGVQPMMQGAYGNNNIFPSAFGATSPKPTTALGADFFGDILQPQGAAASGLNGHSPASSAAANSKLISGDLDASLANLTSNLNLTSGQKKPLGFNDRPKGPPMASVASANARSPQFPFQS